ncbi:hypothetical protein Fot_15430 [Forsythia ovata]|uniref:Uncharacterized protein n=1 Tax=Forsythia ovata TaxID=205694 RepID=A0ABD1W9G4_9LAMI
MDVYIVVSTPLDNDGDTNPMSNFSMKFMVEESALHWELMTRCVPEDHNVDLAEPIREANAEMRSCIFRVQRGREGEASFEESCQRRRDNEVLIKDQTDHVRRINHCMATTICAWMEFSWCHNSDLDTLPQLYIYIFVCARGRVVSLHSFGWSHAAETWGPQLMCMPIPDSCGSIRVS